MSRRPLIALAGSAGTTGRVVPLLTQVGVGARVVSWSVLRRLPELRPDAVVAADTAVLGDLPADVPVAAWVEDVAGVRAAAAHGVEVPLSSDGGLVDHGVVHVPPLALDVGRWPVLPPLVRARMRRRHDLPDRLVVAVDRAAGAEDAAATLALASAAVVTGTVVPLALALGTPVVTNRETARFLGLQDGVEVDVIGDRREADRAACRIADDEERAAALSRRARRFAEHHLDLGRPAAVVRQRLGLEATADAGPAGLLDARLRELGTPTGARIRTRAADALAAFAEPRGALL